MITSTDRIEKKILLRAPRQRIWRALTDPGEFESWFGMKFDGAFTPGARLPGKVTGTTVDSEIAKSQRQYADLNFEVTIDRVEPERLFSFRWHPSAIDPGVDYSREPTTLVVFTLEEAPGGILLTVTESGFD